MNCSDVSELLDRMIFEEVPANDDLRQHLDACRACSGVYSDAVKARAAMALVRRMEPVPADPGELTDHIMAAIGQEPQKKAFLPVSLQQMLAAASVALFMVFGYEQYGVVRKVSALETQCSHISAVSHYPGPGRLASSIDISAAGISFSEVERLLSAGRETSLLSFLDIQKQLIQRKQK